MRSAALCLLSTLPLPLLIQYIYPKMYSLHDMPDDAGLPDKETGEIVLPPPVNLSSERLVPYGLYLIDDGQTQFLWVGRDAVPQLLIDVFGVSDKSQLRVGKQFLPELDNDFNERVRAVIQKSKDHKSKGVGSIASPQLYVVKEDGEPGLRLWAQTMLVEDRADQGVSLQQWMGSLREKVCLSSSPLVFLVDQSLTAVFQWVGGAVMSKLKFLLDHVACNLQSIIQFSDYTMFGLVISTL